MDITLHGGTAQQRAWVTEAIAASTFPYDAFTVPVAITWAASTPCGLNHTYMCTTDHGDNTYTITIEDWADDPAALNNLGLPDPRADIKTFYMQSVVHELGHVAHYAAIVTNELKTQAARLFWKPETNAGSGRRYGGLGDYQPTETTGSSWANAIVEAIAECIKCAFYRGRLVYSNRTNWRIDESNWRTLMQLILGASSAGGFEDSFGSGISSRYGIGSNSGMFGTGVLPPAFLTAGGYGFSSSWIALYNPDVLLSESLVSCRFLRLRLPGWGATNYGQVFVGRGYATPAYRVNLTFADTAEGRVQAQLGVQDNPDAELKVVVDVGQAPYLSGPRWVTAPLWLAMRTTRTSLSAELWDADPHRADVSHRLGALTSPNALPVHPLPAYIEVIDNGVDAPTILDPSWTGRDALCVTDWHYASLDTKYPPYPFASAQGALAAGAGSAGQLRFS